MLCCWRRFKSIQKHLQEPVSVFKRNILCHCGCFLSQMLIGVLLPRWAGALCAVSAGHFSGEGRAAGLRPLSWQRRPRACRRSQYLLVRRCVTWKLHVQQGVQVFKQLLTDRPVSDGLLLQWRVQAVPAVSSGCLPTRSGEDAVLPLWGRAEHQAWRSQLLPWLRGQRSVCLLRKRNEKSTGNANNCKPVYWKESEVGLDKWPFSVYTMQLSTRCVISKFQTFALKEQFFIVVFIVTEHLKVSGQRTSETHMSKRWL